MGGGGMGYSASSSASSGVNANNAFDSSGWTVNFGNQQNVPPWLIVGALVLAGLWLFRRGR
jgi:hypothetical protein